MLNVTAKYVSVFDVVDKEKYVGANITTSKKNQDNTYTNMYWKARFVGTAKEKAKELVNKDRIEIKNGVIENQYDKENNKLWVTVIIFDFEKMEQGE
ncbi:hypothetical protein [Clostridium sp.]|uniref:hypothetical protein n=1 Tax=Clostridium sp. TaxID=1506 RepID=UPI003F2FAF7B